jgi:hypothetical protein
MTKPAFICLAAGALSLGLVNLAWPAGKPDFESRIRPLLTRHCVDCHGPAKQMGGLRLDGRAAALRGGDSGRPAVVPGSSSKSRLFELVTTPNAKLRMPRQGPPLTAVQVALLKEWIDQGAEWPAAAAAKPAGKAEMTVTEKDRQWWSFRPLRQVTPPLVKDPRWSANPIDCFIRAAQERKGLQPSPPASPEKLTRRLYFDVIGLPPPADKAASESPKDLAERLLATPQFGERWARHWLDVARYADSNGQEGDQDRPTAYHYRDFVIRAFNEDLPFDTFVRWQLAGDEYEPDNPLAVSATGFITAGPHTVLDVPMEEEKVRNRLNELDDQLSTTGSAFLGLTVACARCHDHKYDPIPARDYYRMLTAFNSGDRAEVPLLPRAEAARRKTEQQAWKERTDAARKTRDTWLAEQKKPLTEPLRHAKIAALPTRDEEKALLRDKPDDPRARDLARRYSKELAVGDADYRARFSEAQRASWDELTKTAQKAQSEQPDPIPTALAMADFGPAPRETWLLDRGDLKLKKERMELGFLSVLTTTRSPRSYWDHAKAQPARNDTTYQRSAMADWMTDTRSGAGNLLARVIVNRLWQHHFGEGLVRTVNDFGLQGDAPSHPELLEWLAGELVRGGWKLKPIHRLILTSQAYQQDSRYDPVKARLDPENRLLWRRKPQRLEAEAFRDAMLAAAGTLNPERYGPAFKPPIPAEAIFARNLKTPYPRDVQDGPDVRRRSVYMFHKRVVQYPLLQAFDGPDAAASCGRRSVTTVAPQALAVLNEPFVRARADELARRIEKEADAEASDQVDRAYRLTLGRAPKGLELSAGAAFLEKRSAARAPRDGADAKRLALADFAQVLFGLNEFMYVD